MDQAGSDPGYERIGSDDPTTLLIQITAPNLTYKSAPEVSRQLQAEVKDILQSDGDYRTVILDLSGVRLLDSSGASLIIALHKSTEKASAALCLCGAAPHVESILDLLGMKSRIQFFATRREALDAARNR